MWSLMSIPDITIIITIIIDDKRTQLDGCVLFVAGIV